MARRRTLSLALVTALLAGVAQAPTAAGALPPRPDDEYRPVRGPSAPAEFRYLQKTVPGGSLPRHAYDTAARAAARLPAVGGRWSQIGPTNIGGRITSLALDPKRADTVYAAAASGGVWVSRDAGQRFEPAWPDGWTQAMGAVATGPDGTLYAGTGEVNPGGGSITYEGTGLYASRDGGRTWRFLGLRDSGAIGAITVDPADPKRIFVAAAGSLYNAGGDRGVYRSTDGGATWTRVLAGANEFTGATEVLLDPRDPDRLYTVLWDHRRVPDLRTYGGVGSGVFRSTDGGTSWQRLAGGLPAAGPDVGRIGLGQSASDPDRLYAIVNSTAGPFAGFYGSTDGGDAWTRLPDTPELTTSQSTFGWWFGKVWVDPDEPLHVHLAGVPLLTTKDGGQTWTADSTSTHVDHHAMIWDRRYPERVYLGNDGGTYRSDADGDGGWVKATHEPYTQFYSVAITPQDTGRISGGTQDNGSLRSWGGPAFNEYLGGDGEENQINPRDKDTVYACYQYGNCFWSADGGDTMTYFGNKVTGARRNWFTPVVLDPRDPSVMYYGANVLNRSTDGGRTWTPISGDLTGGPGRDPIYTNYGTISTIAPAGDGRTIYVGTDDGRVWVTRDLGGSWTLLLSGQPWVTRVVVDPARAGRVYVTLSAYRSGSNRPYVLGSLDGGRHFVDLSGTLPRAPVNDLVIGRGLTLYVATDQGVFVSPSGGGLWLRQGRGLPMVPVDDIEYDPTNHRLVAGTFGRGIYQVRLD
ncbi:WD40/YVTN/BNR-like repeat-containing protein [Micromonospora sp. GCM10011542]|uniref:WD40/YVTN/BNR-like repeat-containing protein n=1 Tax=Micromonospora sp. GCM10011542 TaxID=3317337 RepID=UPI003609DDB6